MSGTGQLALVADHVLTVSKEIRTAEGERFAPYGLTPTQARVLSVLVDSPPELCMGDLASALDVVPRAITPQVDALERAGLVQRRTDPRNRRSTLVVLTGRGRSVRAQLLAQRVELLEQLFSDLTPGQLDTLQRLLERIVSNR
jgi:DNA-binding MarR family transcriptional regulator